MFQQLSWKWEWKGQGWKKGKEHQEREDEGNIKEESLEEAVSEEDSEDKWEIIVIATKILRKLNKKLSLPQE